MQSTPSLRRAVRGRTRCPTPVSNTGRGAWQSMQSVFAKSFESVRTSGSTHAFECHEACHSSATSAWHGAHSPEVANATGAASGALDFPLREALAARIADVHRRLGTTILQVTHDPREVESYADRTVAMERGTIVRPAVEVPR